MIKNKNAFSLVEVLLIFTVMSVIVAASLPTMTRMGAPVPINVQQGAFYCIARDDGTIEERTYSKRELKLRRILQEGEQCEFRPPDKASVFKIDMVGAGTGGYNYLKVNNPQEYKDDNFYKMASGYSGSSMGNMYRYLNLDELWEAFKKINSINGYLIKVHASIPKGGDAGVIHHSHGTHKWHCRKNGGPFLEDVKDEKTCKTEPLPEQGYDWEEDSAEWYRRNPGGKGGYLIGKYVLPDFDFETIIKPLGMANNTLPVLKYAAENTQTGACKEKDCKALGSSSLTKDGTAGQGIDCYNNDIRTCISYKGTDAQGYAAIKLPNIYLKNSSVKYETKIITNHLIATGAPGSIGYKEEERDFIASGKGFWANFSETPPKTIQGEYAMVPAKDAAGQGAVQRGETAETTTDTNVKNYMPQLKLITFFTARHYVYGIQGDSGKARSMIRYTLEGPCRITVKKGGEPFIRQDDSPTQDDLASTMVCKDFSLTAKGGIATESVKESYDRYERDKVDSETGIIASKISTDLKKTLQKLGISLRSGEHAVGFEPGEDAIKLGTSFYRYLDPSLLEDIGRGGLGIGFIDKCTTAGITHKEGQGGVEVTELAHQPSNRYVGRFTKLMVNQYAPTATPQPKVLPTEYAVSSCIDADTPSGSGSKKGWPGQNDNAKDISGYGTAEGGEYGTAPGMYTVYPAQSGKGGAVIISW